MAMLYALLPSLARVEALDDVRPRLARADRLESGASGELAATACFSWTADNVPAGALTREHLAGDAGEAVWLCADPACVEADMDSARMLACGSLDLAQEQAEELARPLRPLFGDNGMRLEVTSPSRWHLRLPAGSPLPAFDPPATTLGDDLISHLPAGDDGRRWRRLFNEAQILLHQNPVNRARRQAGKMPANSLWLWGAGRLPTRVTSDVRQIYADEVLTLVLARQARVDAFPVDAFEPDRPLPADTLLDLGRSGAPHESMELVLGMLERRRADILIVHFAGGERWRLTRGQRWRLWRKNV
jgi:hypothetical protein